MNIENIMSSSEVNVDVRVEKKLKYSLDSFDDIVVFIVGPDKKLFRIHKKMLCQASAYFAAALNGNFKEARDQTIELPEDDVEIITYFQYWLYCRDIPIKTSNKDGDDREDKTDWQFKMLIDLFIFSEARGIPELQNAAIHFFINNEYGEAYLPTHYIRYVYRNVSASSPLRRLLVDMTHSYAHMNVDNTLGAWFPRESEDYCKDFLLDLAAAYCERVNGNKEKITDFRAVRSNYYVEMPEHS